MRTFCDAIEAVTILSEKLFDGLHMHRLADWIFEVSTSIQWHLYYKNK